MKSDSIPSAVQHTRRTFELQAIAALAGLVTAASAPARVRRGRQARRLPAGPPPCSFIPPREKYPGQARAYLVGASRPMTESEIREHNAAVTDPHADRRAAA